MVKAGADPEVHGLAAGKPSAAEIKRHLLQVMASATFHGSKRCQQFLGYACRKALTGEDADLKERTIAIEVFGRRPQSDLADDTIVRVSAREVRKRLAQFYQTPEGIASGLRIVLPTGSYTPRFQYAVPEVEPEAAPIIPAPAAAPLQSSRMRLLVPGLILLSLIAGIGVGALVWSRPAGPRMTGALQRFWEPVMNSPQPLLLAIPHPLVYHPSARALNLNDQLLPSQSLPLQRPLQIPRERLDGSDMVPVIDQYVGFGDLVESSEIAAMLAKYNKTVRVRMATSLRFEDFRQNPALLIGATTNRWTLEMQQSWRFQFTRPPGQRTAVITDRQKGVSWSIAANEDGSAVEDYILISRVRNAGTGAVVMGGAGLKQFGTEAAGRLLSSPDQIEMLIRDLPGGWENRNMQAVLHAKVIGNAPAQPGVVAWHVW